MVLSGVCRGVDDSPDHSFRLPWERFQRLAELINKLKVILVYNAIE